MVMKVAMVKDGVGVNDNDSDVRLAKKKSSFSKSHDRMVRAQSPKYINPHIFIAFLSNPISNMYVYYHCISHLVYKQVNGTNLCFIL